MGPLTRALFDKLVYLISLNGNHGLGVHDPPASKQKKKDMPRGRPVRPLPVLSGPEFKARHVTNAFERPVCQKKSCSCMEVDTVVRQGHSIPQEKGNRIPCG